MLLVIPVIQQSLLDKDVVAVSTHQDHDKSKDTDRGTGNERNSDGRDIIQRAG